MKSEVNVTHKMHAMKYKFGTELGGNTKRSRTTFVQEKHDNSW